MSGCSGRLNISALPVPESSQPDLGCEMREYLTHGIRLSLDSRSRCALFLPLRRRLLGDPPPALGGGGAFLQRAIAVSL